MSCHHIKTFDTSLYESQNSFQFTVLQALKALLSALQPNNPDICMMHADKVTSHCQAMEGNIWSDPYSC